MGERTEQIKHDIEQARSRLGQNLNELEYRVKTTTDWRVQFERHPWAFVGVAFGTAFVLGLILARRTPPSNQIS